MSRYYSIWHHEKGEATVEVDSILDRALEMHAWAESDVLLARATVNKGQIELAKATQRVEVTEKFIEDWAFHLAGLDDCNAPQ